MWEGGYAPSSNRQSYLLVCSFDLAVAVRFCILFFLIFIPQSHLLLLTSHFLALSAAASYHRPKKSGKSEITKKLGTRASASKRTDEIQTRDNFLTLLPAGHPANWYANTLPTPSLCSHPPFVDWQFRVLNFYPAQRHKGESGERGAMAAQPLRF